MAEVTPPVADPAKKIEVQEVPAVAPTEAPTPAAAEPVSNVPVQEAGANPTHINAFKQDVQDAVKEARKALDEVEKAYNKLVEKI